MSRVGLVVGPHSGSGRAVRAAAVLRAALGSCGHELLELSAPTYGQALAGARAATTGGHLDVLAVCGGDGLVHLGVNACAQTPVPLLIVAAGTGNDNARELGLPVHDPVATARLLERGVTRQVDLGRVAARSGHPPSWFIGVLGGGFDAAVAARAARLQRVPSRARYPLAILRELATFRPIPYRVRVDEITLDTEAMLVAVANGPAFGGGMRVCPQASYTDGILDVLVLEAMSVPAFLSVFPRVYAGTHTTHPRVRLLRGREVRLEPGTQTGRPIPTQADGESGGELPLECALDPGALTICG